MAGGHGGMARSAMYAGRGVGRGWSRGVGDRMRGWGEVVAVARRRALEGIGFTLMVTSFLLILTLLTYDPGDPSLDTAVDHAPRNFLGQGGAILADILIQAIGIAAYLVPIVLLGWSFRYLLQRPLQSMLRRTVQLVAMVLLGSFACSILTLPMKLPAGGGGVVGWTILRFVEQAGLRPLSLPLAMTAAALVAAMLLSIMGLSWGDWRTIGRGAGRGASLLARASGRGTLRAAMFGGSMVRSWRELRRDALEEPIREPLLRPRGTAPA